MIPKNHKNDDMHKHNNTNQNQLTSEIYSNDSTTNLSNNSFQIPNQKILINQNGMLSQMNFCYLFTPISTNEVIFTFNMQNPYRINYYLLTSFC